ncbi:MAG: hypothetical protein NT027_07835, partial [Proteobacteria bacterium]|nr:hypothetical protein [Pseudomonadota bacterium]
SEVLNSNDQHWSQIVSCNGGDAIVDVDLGERRNFQLVLKNKFAFAEFDQTGWTHAQIKNDNERIYRGRAIDGKGVFNGHDFVGFFANDVGGGSGTTFGWKVKLEVGTSDHSAPWKKLKFTAVDLKKCGGQLRGNDFPKECSIGEHEWNTCEVKQ